MRRGILAFVMGMCLLACMTSIPTASADTGTAWLYGNNYWYYPVTVEGGQMVTYDIQVTSGPSVDIFLMDATNTGLYFLGYDFDYIEAGSVLNTYHGLMMVNVNPGQYYVVVDNTDRGITEEAVPPTFMNTASISYDISVEASTLGDIGGIIITVVILAAVVLIVVLFFYFINSKLQSPKSAYQYPAYQQSVPPADTYQAPQQYQSPPAYSEPSNGEGQPTKTCSQCGSQIFIGAPLCPICNAKQ